ncbi:MAG: hypothetical protein ACYCYM_12005 [Saccharofermentanales bacterium]
MIKREMKKIIAESVNSHKLCRCYFIYKANYWYYFPLKATEKLFLSTEENDFILDGYSIRRFKDMTKVEIKNDLCDRILREEGIIDSIKVPEVDITNWETIFKSLMQLNKNVIVEKEDLDEDSEEFVIGRIEKITRQHVHIREFDADGIWQQDLCRIPYNEITSLTFGSRYVEMFSKYVDSLYPGK